MNKSSPSNTIVCQVSTWRMTSCTGSRSGVRSCLFFTHGPEEMIEFLFTCSGVRLHEEFSAAAAAAATHHLLRGPINKLAPGLGLREGWQWQTTGDPTSFYSVMKDNRVLPENSTARKTKKLQCVQCAHRIPVPLTDYMSNLNPEHNK